MSRVGPAGCEPLLLPESGRRPALVADPLDKMGRRFRQAGLTEASRHHRSQVGKGAPTRTGDIRRDMGATAAWTPHLHADDLVGHTSANGERVTPRVPDCALTRTGDAAGDAAGDTSAEDSARARNRALPYRPTARSAFSRGDPRKKWPQAPGLAATRALIVGTNGPSWGPAGTGDCDGLH